MNKFYLAIFTFLINSIYAQDTQKYSENIYLSTDRNIYISGEDLYFSTFIADNKLNISILSNILYIDISGNKNNKIFSSKYKIREGKVNDVIKLPEDINSGIYKLNAYTKFQRNFSMKYASEAITIINPDKPFTDIDNNFSVNTKEHDSTSTNKKLNYKSNQNDGFDINITKTIYKPRQKVHFNVINNLNEEIKFLTISIAKKNSINTKILSCNKLMNTDSINNNRTFYPEINGLSLSGIVRNKTSHEPIKNANVYASVIGKQPDFKISKTNENGDFSFILYYLKNNNDIFIGTNADSSEVLIYNDFTDSYTNNFDFIPEITQNYKKLINELYVNKQITTLFHNNTLVQKDFADSINANYPIYVKPDISILLKDFIQLPTIHETFDEIIPHVKVKKKSNNFYLSVYDAKTMIFYDDPLILIDNIPIFDVNELLKIKPLNVYKIEVVNHTYIYGNAVIKGIVALSTKTNNYAGIKLPINSIVVEYNSITPCKKIIFPPVTNENTNRNLPYFRNTLYWNPDVEINKNNKINFYTSDHCAEYIILAKALLNSGKSVYAEKTFFVRNKK